MPSKREPKSIVGRRLRERREALGLSQEQIGVAIGLDESTARARISRYEVGEHEPPYATVKLLADVLSTPVAYIYCDDELIATFLLELHKLPLNDRCNCLKLLIPKLACGP